MTRTKKPNISHELFLCQYQNGIKLITPEKKINDKNIYHQPYKGQTVSNLLQLPLCIHFSDITSKISIVNEGTAEACGFISPVEATGKSMYSVSRKESANRVIDNCNNVIKTKKASIFEENVTRLDDKHNHCLSIKLPWYDDEDNIIGVFGCTVVLGLQSLSDSLSLISDLGFLNALTKTYEKSVKLSLRQQQCLYYLTEGMEIKEIARQLSLSPRTVEHYLDTIKIKLNCKTKLQLIKKVIGSDSAWNH